MTAALAQRFDSPEVAFEEPIPLRPEMSPAAAYPLEALGPLLHGAARGIMATVRVADALAAQTVLAAASLALQGHIDIELPTGDVMPTSLFMVTVAASGDRKSAADRRALAAVYEREEQLRKEWEEAQAEYKINLAAFKSAEGTAKQRNKDNAELQREALRSLGAEPVPPVAPFIVVEAPTAQAIQKLYKTARPSLGLFSDEGGNFLGGYSMSDDNRLATSTILSGLWDGKPVKKNTAGEDALFLPGRRLSFHLMVQPGVSLKLFGAADLKDQGFMSRVLPAAPTTLRGSRLFAGHVVDPADLAALDLYRERTRSILARALPMHDFPDMKLHPRVVRLSRPATEAWRSFHDAVEERIGPGGEWEAISGFAGKLPEHAARLAAIVANVVEWTGELSVEDIGRGFELAVFYAGEMLRLTDSSAVPADIAAADQLREWIVKQAQPVVGLRQISQKVSPTSLRNLGSKGLRALCDTLAEAGHLVHIPNGALIDGQRARVAWRVVGVKP